MDHRKFDFTEITSIVWPNGSGKSHILEAIHILAGGKVLIPHERGGTWFQIEWFFWESGMEKQYILIKADGKEQHTIQWTKISKKKYLKEIPYVSVYIGPFEMNLLYLNPSIRREYIDAVLGQTFESFGVIEREYHQILKQRNALLKKIREQEAKKEDLDFWDKKLASTGTLYHMYRKKYIQTIKDGLGHIADRYKITPIYESSIPDTEDVEWYICNYLQENRERDIFSGHTHIWPHRDDIRFIVEHAWESQDAIYFLSRWEMKILLMEIKEIELRFYEKHLGKKVLLLIDDIFAELDEENAKKILDRFRAYQTIITSQRKIPEHLSTKSIHTLEL